MYFKLLPWLLLAVAGGFLYQQIKTNTILSSELNSKNAIIETERINAQDAANRQLARIIEEEKRDKEHKKLVACVANKSCGFKLRFQSCPPVPSASSSGSESTESATESYRQFQQWNLDHRELIGRYEARVKELEVELIARSKPDFCQPK